MELLDAILQDRLDVAGPRLREAGFQDPKRAFDSARRMLGRLSPPEFGQLFNFVIDALSVSCDPDRALNNLDRYQQISAGGLQPAWLARERPYLLRLLLDLFGFSQFLSDVLIRYPHYTAWLGDTDVLEDDPSEESLQWSLDRAMAPFSSADKRQHAVVRWFRRELLRAGVRVMMGRTDELAFALELSRIAVAVIRAGVAESERPLRRRFGVPMTEPTDPEEPAVEAGFAVVAMGKLGGMELNFSSDVDLIFVYADEGRTGGLAGSNQGPPQGRISNHEYFRRLAESLIHFLTEPTEEGYLYRVDTRLRPDGAEGPLVHSIGAFEAYHETAARPWERMALAKCRAIAGDPALCARFDDLSLGLVFGRAMGPEIIDEVRDLKLRIDAGVESGEEAGREIKRGRGGIREIEFHVQALQLLHGQRYADLRVRSTLDLVPALAGRGLLSEDEASQVAADYTFLRRVEHRLQMMDLRQTHTLPDEPHALDCLALRCGLRASSADPPGQVLLQRWDEISTRVRSRFVLFFGAADEEAGSTPVRSPAEHLARLIAADAPDAELISLLAPHSLDSGGVIAALRRMGGRGRALALTRRAVEEFPRVLEVLLAAAGRSARPAQAVIQLESLLFALGSYAGMYEIFINRPRLLELLVRAFGAGDVWARTLGAHREFIDVLLTGEPWAADASSHALRERLRQVLRRGGRFGSSALSDDLALFRRFESLMTGLAELALSLPFERVTERLTSLADVVVEAALGFPAKDTDTRGIAVLAMGKLGTRELNFQSDLDLIFAWDDHREPQGGARAHLLAEHLTSTLTQSTPDGVPYHVDTRLRPEGTGAPLAPARSRFLDYYARRAQLWEVQSFMKVRPVAGDLAFGAELIREIAEVLASRLRREFDSAALAGGVRAMRLRIEASVNTPSWVLCDFKKGPGGVMDLDFIAQYFQLLALRDGEPLLGQAPPAVFNWARLRALLDPEEASVMTRNYVFLRQLESRSRLLFETESSRAPDGGEKARGLGRAIADLLPGDPIHWQAHLTGVLAENRSLLTKYLPVGSAA